ncbi:ammonia-dependent NAD(+) synthetase [Fructilactobacillus florum]|uniref:ammonia-dependent NAD(+) synthetase n=1 Tax=Fructilactobacillus florum TaxID=640331 RepID=UPI0006D24813|nr:ammonia-dependent NAD(+) synthetase [Fructilactobacillus florum]
MQLAQRQQQEKIIAALRVQPKIDPQAELRRSIDFIKEYVKATGMQTTVLGISGGQDSTLTGKLAQLAMNELRQETHSTAYQFIAVRLPYGEQADESDAMAAIEYIGADQVVRIDIKPATDAAVAAVTASGATVSDFNKGNIKARQRMIAQYAIAGAQRGLVLGTDHAAEAVTGFYTKFGDGACDLTPLWRLDKRQGKELLQMLAAPERLYKKIPTADLEDQRPALPDEAALGVTYQEIDDFLEGHDIAERPAAIIENLYQRTAHKRHAPVTVFDTFWKTR